MISIPPTSFPRRLRQSEVYDRGFWLAYLANWALVTANALTFRFAELVAYLGGTEQLVGVIVSTGIGGALLVRLVLGQAIDRYGPRHLWMSASVVFTLSCLMFLTCSQLGWQLFVARILFAASVAAMFTCSIVHVQRRVPAQRRTEVIGNLGSSGFLGMITGALAGDWILNRFGDLGRYQFWILFGGAAGLGLLYLVVVWVITRRDNPQQLGTSPSAVSLLKLYWPGNVVLVALMMGVSITVTTVFLTRYATLKGFSGIGVFFFAYAVSAFVFRITTRSWSNTVGRHRMVLRGLCGHAIGHMTLPLVMAEWQFIFPAIGCGFGHALLFPAVVSKGSGSFPPRFRGTGTTLVLGFFDLGAALSAPILGSIIDQMGFTAMFLSSGSTALVIAGIYAVTAARSPDEDHVEETLGTEPRTEAGALIAEPETVPVQIESAGVSPAAQPCSAESV